MTRSSHSLTRPQKLFVVCSAIITALVVAEATAGKLFTLFELPFTVPTGPLIVIWAKNTPGKWSTSPRKIDYSAGAATGTGVNQSYGSFPFSMTSK